jgi:hypothetical protein
MIENNIIRSAVYLEAGKERLLICGTPEWDQRENDRAAAGCRCLSFGSIIGDGKIITLKVDASQRNK